LEWLRVWKFPTDKVLQKVWQEHCCLRAWRLTRVRNPGRVRMSYRRQKSTFWLLLAAGVFAGLLGCGDSARKPVQVHPIQIGTPPALEPLPTLPVPLDAHRGSVTPLMTFEPDGVQWLAAQSQAVFDAGERDFREGRVEKAREEYDQALD